MRVSLFFSARRMEAQTDRRIYYRFYHWLSLNFTAETHNSDYLWILSLNFRRLSPTRNLIERSIFREAYMCLREAYWDKHIYAGEKHIYAVINNLIQSWETALKEPECAWRIYVLESIERLGLKTRLRCGKPNNKNKRARRECNLTRVWWTQTQVW